MEDRYKVLLQPIVSGVVRDVEKGLSPATISARFHLTLIRLFADLCEVIRRDSGLSRVALSGGVFQNSILLTGLIQTLTERGFEVFCHRLVPTNDGGISLGQALIAACFIH